MPLERYFAAAFGNNNIILYDGLDCKKWLLEVYTLQSGYKKAVLKNLLSNPKSTIDEMEDREFIELAYQVVGGALDGKQVQLHGLLVTIFHMKTMLNCVKAYILSQIG